MDWLYRAYPAVGRWGHGPDDTFTMRWYKAAPGAQVYTGVHAFGSTVDKGCQTDDPNMIGEIPMEHHPYLKSGPQLYDGSTPAVETAYLQWGIPPEVVAAPCARGCIRLCTKRPNPPPPVPMRYRSGSGKGKDSGGTGGGGTPSRVTSVSLAALASCGLTTGLSTPLLTGVSHLLIACVGIDPFPGNPIAPAFVAPAFNGTPFTNVNEMGFGIDWTLPSVAFWRMQLGAVPTDGIVTINASAARGYYLILTQLNSLLPNSFVLESGGANTGSGTAPSFGASVFSPFPTGSYNQAFVLMTHQSHPWTWDSPYFSGGQDITNGGLCNLDMTEGYCIQASDGHTPAGSLSGITPATWLAIEQNFLVM